MRERAPEHAPLQLLGTQALLRLATAAAGGDAECGGGTAGGGAAGGGSTGGGTGADLRLRRSDVAAAAAHARRASGRPPSGR